MSNTIVRIALVNMLLSGIFVILITQQMGSPSLVAFVLGTCALVINVVFMLKNPEGQNTPPVASAARPGSAERPVMARTTNAVDLPQALQPRRAQAGEEEQMPPWLRVKGNIVMTWEDKHHVAPINGDDPFEVAQRLHARLRRMSAETQARDGVEKPVADTTTDVATEPARPETSTPSEKPPADGSS